MQDKRTIAMPDVTAMMHLAIMAWPALTSSDIDGWLWRSSGGGSKRANSTAALAFTGADVEHAIDSVEQRYLALDRPVRFQLDDSSRPSDLYARLERRGYVCEEVTITMAKPVGVVSPPASCELLPAPSSDWLSVYLSAITPDRRAMNQRILDGVPPPRSFFLHRVAGRPVSTGLSVASGPLAIVECMATSPHDRRAGGANAILDAIESWAGAQGAATLFLQVVDGNTPAQTLYTRAGYRAVATTRYLVRS